MTVSMLDKYCPLGKTEQEIVKTAFENLKLTARSYHRLIKVSRTIADLDASENIKAEHIYEAISYHSTIDGNK
jgi:magnesium chelatase family protein